MALASPRASALYHNEPYSEKLRRAPAQVEMKFGWWTDDLGFHNNGGILCFRGARCPGRPKRQYWLPRRRPLSLGGLVSRARCCLPPVSRHDGHPRRPPRYRDPLLAIVPLFVLQVFSSWLKAVLETGTTPSRTLQGSRFGNSNARLWTHNTTVC